MFDYEWGITDDSSNELFFGYLLEVGEAELGEEFLGMVSMRIRIIYKEAT